MSGFREALGRHLLAIEEKDIDALLHLEYRETPPGKPPVRQESLLTLVFQNRGGRWLMFQDQNTPIK